MAAASRASRKPYVLWGLLGLLFAISATYRVLDISERVGELRHGREFVREPFDVDLPRYELVGVEQEAERAGLKPGDRLTSINNQGLHYSGTDLWVPLRARRAGDRLTVEATRLTGGQSSTVSASIVLQPLRPGPPSTLDVTQFAVLNVLMPIVCTVLGFWVAAVRVRDGRAWLLLLLLLSVAEFAGGNLHFLYGRQDFFQPIAAAYQPVLANFWPTAMLLFAIYFPERLRLDRRVPWVKWVVIAPVAVRVIGTNPVFEYVARRNPQAALGVHSALEPTAGYVGATYLLFILAFLAIMTYRTFTERQPDARRRLLLLDAGAVVSLIPAFIFLAFFLAGRRTFAEWLAFPILGFLFLFPLTMAYVIVVHRAMDVRVVVRQGLQYMLARGGIRAIQITLLIAVTFAATVLLAGGAGIGRVSSVVTGMVVVVAIGRRFADRLRRWVDRRFFREAYEADAILSDLATKVRTMIETGPLLETVGTRIAESLHVRRIAILLDGGGAFELAYALGYGALPPTVSIPADGVTVKRLRGQQHALVQFDDADSWAQLTAGAERRSLEELQPELLLPLSLNEKILGIMSLGPKQSEEPFSRMDMRLLDSVAAQTGLALENGRLTAAVAAEVAARAKQTRDIEIARDVQQRLFPQEYPPIPGLDYAGACRAALGVGGDYYDFILLSKTRLGVAIGDVSGKGVPASLLMATLRAYLRGAQTTHHQPDLTEVMRNLNRLVYESSDANRYATFFYGELDATSRALTYVNAGHNPPMVFRQAGSDCEVLRLDTGGPVIGLMEGCNYQQGGVTLAAGDVLVAYTDGISEAMNAADEEWGEERLMDAVRPNRGLTARALIDRLMASADTFAAGAPQHDDMTLLVLRAV